jgi:hypothetical protein
MAAQSVVRLGLESNQYERGIKQARRSFDDFTKGIGAGVLKLSAVSAAITATTTALKVVKDAFHANESAMDAWGQTLESAKSIYQGFLQSLNNGDIGGFLGNINNIVNAAKEAYNALDELNTRMTIINPERAKIQARQTELKATIRREGAGSAAGIAAQAELKQTEKELRHAFVKESEMNYDVFKKEVDRKLAEANIHLDKNSYNYLMRSFSDDDLFKQGLQANARGSRFENTNLGKKAAYLAQRDTRNTNQKLLDVFTDEWRTEWSRYLTASYNARGSAASMELGNARYLRTPSGGGRSGGKGAIGPQQMLMLEGMSALTPTGYLSSGSPSMSSADMAAWFSQNMFTKGLADQARQFGWDMQDKEGPSRSDKLLQGIDDLTGAMNHLYGGLEDMGIKLPKGMQQLLGGINGLITVIQAMQAAKEAFGFIKALLFSGGGVAHAAQGWSVPGNLLSGDRVPAMLNSGEVVLNRAQVGNLAAQLSGPQIRAGQNGRTVVSGEDIVLAVENYGRRIGRKFFS